MLTAALTELRGMHTQLAALNRESSMKKSLGMFVLMTVFCVAVFMLFLAVRPAPAQSSYFGGNDGGMGRYHGYVPQPGYRAINHDPATGRTYSREADYLTPKHRTPKRKTR
jgi:hypothetical protein